MKESISRQLELPLSNIIEIKLFDVWGIDFLVPFPWSVGNTYNWSSNLDDASWAYHTTFKSLIGISPYKLVFGKSFHLSVELEHKALWSLKRVNLNWEFVAKNCVNQFLKLHEYRLKAYESSTLYKEKLEQWHDVKILPLECRVGELVVLFNSRLKLLPGKLKSKWTSPYTIIRVYGN
ncbi:hypothetical protein MTR67_002942 [Solanum verrucosum]|uniref:Uncharacterized protein n=1 Tax=Solanum verrucosum TaxID=315347 RepID=A0AAF0PRY9_SOLVR|nr:hypothetical protein MTR67_002942 [Solanum verrucosum]